MMCKCDGDNNLPDFLCMKCWSEPSKRQSLVDKWQEAFGELESELTERQELEAKWKRIYGKSTESDAQKEPETYELDDWLDGAEHEPVTLICAFDGLLMTLWQDGNVIACWSTITGREQSCFYGWTVTVERARELMVAT